MASLECISTVGNSNLAAFSPFAGVVVTYINIYYITLPIAELEEDLGDKQLLARAVGSCLLTAMKASEGELVDNIAIMAIKWVIQVISMEDVMGSLALTALTVLAHLADKFREFLLEAIQVEEDIGLFVLSQRETEDFSVISQKVLETLGYEEA
jgi:hypothetical protein